MRRSLLYLLWVGAILLAVAAVADYGLGRYQREQAKQTPFVGTTKARRGNFVVYTDEVGVVESEESMPVKSETGGQVLSLVANGSVVKEGDVILRLDTPRIQLACDQAERNVQSARDKIRTSEHDLGTAVRQAELALERAKDDQELAQAKADSDRKDKEAQLKFDQDALAEQESKLERKRRLAAAGLIPGEEVRRGELDMSGQTLALEKQQESLELENAKAKSEALGREAQVRLATSSLDQAKSRLKDEMRNTRTELQSQERQLQRAREDLAKAVVKAQKDGMVAWAELGRGPNQTGVLQEADRVWTNQVVGQVLDLSKIQVVLQLPQRVGPMAKKGQRARVWLNGLPGVSFPGKVTQVASFASQADRWGPASDERTFRTCVRVGEFESGLLKPGMRATVRIVIAEVKNVVSVPAVCVFTRGLGKSQRWIVWKKRGRDFTEVPVKLGQANDEAVVIEGGLDPGAEIALRDLRSEASRTSPTPRAASLAGSPPVEEGIPR